MEELNKDMIHVDGNIFAYDSSKLYLRNLQRGWFCLSQTNLDEFLRKRNIKDIEHFLEHNFYGKILVSMGFRRYLEKVLA